VNPIRLVLVDDHPLILHALQDVLESTPDLTVVASCKTVSEALAAIREHRPDVLVLDVRLGGEDGLGVMRQMRQEQLPVRTVLLTAAIDDAQLMEATRLGVSGIVLKEMAPSFLVSCIRKVHGGEQWFERRAVSRVLETLLRREAGAGEAAGVLTRRELEVVRMVGRGLRNKQISEDLHISEGTVKVHLHNIYEKLSVKSRLELACYARDKGLL
jgi:DNA-binding NarL/FixJ family response regulator